MSRHVHASTFSEFFKKQDAKTKKPEISGFPARHFSPDFKDQPRDFPGREERELREYVWSMMGGTRTIAPHPDAVHVRAPAQDHILPPSTCELTPKVHTPKRAPGVAQPHGKARYHGDDDGPEAHALRVEKARDHVNALRDTLAMAELRLARLIGE